MAPLLPQSSFASPDAGWCRSVAARRCDSGFRSTPPIPAVKIYRITRPMLGRAHPLPPNDAPAAWIMIHRGRPSFSRRRDRRRRGATARRKTADVPPLSVIEVEPESRQCAAAVRGRPACARSACRRSRASLRVPQCGSRSKVAGLASPCPTRGYGRSECSCKGRRRPVFPCSTVITIVIGRSSHCGRLPLSSAFDDLGHGA